MRTDISEDPKGDPTKILPHQPTPRVRTDDDDEDRVEPLLPKPEQMRPVPRRQAQTPADRRGLGQDSGKE